MSFAFYVYTILIMGVGLVAASTALVVWLMMRRRDCLVAASGFLLYIWVTLRLRDKVTLARVAAFVVPVAVLQFALVPRTGFAGHVQQYLFWLTCDLGTIFCLAYAYIRYRKTEKLHAWCRGVRLH